MINQSILEQMELDALNMESVKGYRVLFEQLHEGHPWNKLMKDEFLIKLKAAAKNKKGTVSPIAAGILMFGDADRITDVFPDYFLDYREEFYAGGNSDPRNPNLLKMFGFVNVGERAGSGVDKIMTAWEEQNWRKPEYDIALRAERVTLKLQVGQIVYIPGAADLRENAQKESEYKYDDEDFGFSGVRESMCEYGVKNFTEKEQIIMEYLERHTEVSMGKATQICGYKTKSATRKVIGKLLDKGVIKKIGSGPQTRYILSSFSKKTPTSKVGDELRSLPT